MGCRYTLFTGLVAVAVVLSFCSILSYYWEIQTCHVICCRRVFCVCFKSTHDDKQEKGRDSRDSRGTDGFMNMAFLLFSPRLWREHLRKKRILNRDSHFLLRNFFLRGGCTKNRLAGGANKKKELP